jgi:ABC-type branched-subunit amino acid transport system substrate-binding protein
MTTNHRRAVVAAVAAAALLLSAACSTKSTDGSSGGTATGTGVSAKSIKLGVLTDRTGVFAAAGKGVEQGRDLFWNEKNEEGGVCGRKVEFVVKDHGYNAQQAVSAYAQLEGEVLALDELLGSPMIAALLPNLETDEMLTFAASFSSSLLANPYVVVTGATYDIEMINGLHYLADQKKVAKGDTIGHILLDGDYGANALAGSRAAANDLGVTIVEHKIKPTDTDLTGQVTALRKSGAKVVLLTTTAAQTASAVAVAEASGYDATFLGSNPAFSPALLKSPARAALEKRLLIATSVAPFAAEGAGPTEVRNGFNTKYGSAPKSNWVMYGYAQGEIMAKILETACKNDALTRPGLLKAFQSLNNVDTRGLLPPLDFTDPGAIPARQVRIVVPDSKVDGGQRITVDLFAAKPAETYQRAGS